MTHQVIRQPALKKIPVRSKPTYISPVSAERPCCFCLSLPETITCDVCGVRERGALRLSYSCDLNV